MINSELFINLSFFNFKSVKNLSCEIFFIEKKFYNELKNSSNNWEFHNKIFSNKDNSAIFYTGLENDAEEKTVNLKKKKYIRKLKNIFFFNNNKYKDEFHVNHKYTKTIIKFKNPNNKTKRLLSILIIIKNIDANKQKINKNNYKNNLYNSFINYYLFPISYEDWHE